MELKEFERKLLLQFEGYEDYPAIITNGAPDFSVNDDQSLSIRCGWKPHVGLAEKGLMVHIVNNGISYWQLTPEGQTELEDIIELKNIGAAKPAVDIEVKARATGIPGVKLQQAIRCECFFCQMTLSADYSGGKTEMMRAVRTRLEEAEWEGVFFGKRQVGNICTACMVKYGTDE